MKKTDIILAGVGGQGILSIAAVIGLAALRNGLSIKQAEVHGMSQRGGAVQSHLRISDGIVYSDLIPQGSADLVISVEPMEALRYISWLSADAWLVSNTEPFINIPSYPELEPLLEEIRRFRKNILFNADAIAQEAGSLKASNMAILGAASPFIQVETVHFEEGIKSLFQSKGTTVVDMNLQAFRLGRMKGLNQLNACRTDAC
jgi:indolepyruvate ferredoxin oxidoreductase, beta subunit